MDENYLLIVKTGDAEFRALRQLTDDVRSEFLPLVELTRGRKRKDKSNPNRPIYPYNKKIENLIEIFNNKTIAIDVTTEPDLTSPEIDLLYLGDDGYHNWIDLLQSLKDSNAFKSIIPSVLFNYDDPDFEKNIQLQLEHLSNKFDTILYRLDIEDDGYLEDLNIIKENTGSEITLIVVLDCKYIPAASYKNAVSKCNSIIKDIKTLLTERRLIIIVASTTFPNNVADVGNDKTDTFDIREIDLHHEVLQSFPEVVYGDYGSINPIRNDQIMLSRGWIPRIDCPLESKIFYYRKRRPEGVTSYASTYRDVARQVVNDPRFPKKVEKIWGLDQIKLCADGIVPSAVPSFWISVRMNTYVSQQVLRLK